MKKPITNKAASVHAHLLKRAKAEDRPFIELLQYYAMERFLYRLSRSEHAERFVLKGALMLQFWGGPLSRATKDIDLLGRPTTNVSELVAIVTRCLGVEVSEGWRTNRCGNAIRTPSWFAAASALLLGADVFLAAPAWRGVRFFKTVGGCIFYEFQRAQEPAAAFDLQGHGNTRPGAF